MITTYRKNSKWKAVYISIESSKLDSLDKLVGEKVRSNMTDKEKKAKRWTIVDIVDTIVVASNSNPINQKHTLELLIYVADMTGKEIN